MNGEQLHQLAIEAARNLPFSEQTHPFGPEYEVFKILEKMFMLTVEVSGIKMINVKCDPYKVRNIRNSIHLLFPAIT